MSCHNFYETGQNFWSLDIHTAASLGDVMYFVKYDVRKLKSDLEILNSSGWTPLMFASARGHSPLVNYLLLIGAQKNCKTNSGVTSLMLAITSGSLSTVETVFDSTIIEERDYRKWTALFYAIQFTTEKCISFLLQKGANVDVVDFQNETPLMMAIKIGRKAMVQLIVQSATNLNVVSYKQESALTLANESNCPHIKTMVHERYLNLMKIYETNLQPFSDVCNGAKTYEASKNSNIQDSLTASYKSELKPNIKLGKSLTFFPSSTSKYMGESSKNSSPWKISFSKKFWSPQSKPQDEIQNFLKKLGLKKYWPIFRDEEVDFETLLTLNNENLIELGIGPLGPRKKIMLAIQEIKRQF